MHGGSFLFVAMALGTCRRSKDCWCRDCHALRREQFSNDDMDTLTRKFLRSEVVEENALKDVFCQVLDRSAIVYTFKLKMKTFTGFTYPKSYLKATGLAEDKAAALADNINLASSVYEHLKDIVDNVMQFENINIRRLSMNQLYLAKEISWCFQYLESLKCRGKKPEELVYNEQDFKDLENLVRSSAGYLALEKDLMHKMIKSDS